MLRRTALLALLMLLASGRAGLAAPLDDCLRGVLPKIYAGCEAIHTNSSIAAGNATLTAVTLTQWIGACLSTGQELSILAPNLSISGYVLSQNYTAALAAATPWGSPGPVSLNVSFTPISTWGRTLSQIAGVPPMMLGLEANASVSGSYDAFLVDPVALADLYDAGLTLDLSQMVVDAPYKEMIEWVGIHQLFRGSVVVAEGAVSSLPFGGLVYQMYYRRDVLASHNLTAPATWDDFLEVAARVNGTDMNGDGKPDYGVCLQRPQYCFNGFSLAAIWSSFVQTKGTKQGAFFDPITMEPLVNNSAMEAAMKLYVKLRDYGPPDERTSPCLPYNAAFTDGRCALTLSWGYQLKANVFKPTSRVRDKVSVALLPGSTQVLNRTTGKLEPCTSRTVCPYAQELPTGPDGVRRLVNRAPYLALASVSAALSARAGVWQQTTLLSFFATLTSSNVSWDLVTSPRTELGPYRYEHFDRANLWQWVRRGYPADVISEFLEVMKAQVDSENVMLEVRTVQAYAYRRALDLYATLVSEGVLDIPTAISRMADSLAAAYSKRNPRFDTIRRLYLYSIGYLDGVASGPPPPPPAPRKDFIVGRAGGIGAAVVLLVMVVIASVIIGTVINAAQRRRRRLFSEWRPMGHPGMGEDTTLVVSDVEGSTALWEAIEPATMDVVFNLHHNCMRRTAVRYNGYESQTEGDSFIIAFHLADDAVQFALAVQAALLEEPWPPELLSHEKCRPVWLARTAVDVPLDLPYEPAAAHHQHHHHHHRGGGGGGAGFVVGGGAAESLVSRQGTPYHVTSGSVTGAATAGSGSAGAATPGGSVATPVTAAAATAPGAGAPPQPATGSQGGDGRLGLRRLLARRGQSRQQLQSIDGAAAASVTPAGSESLYDALGGGGADGASGYGSLNGGAVPSGAAMPPPTPAPPPMSIDSVAEALRVMWREVAAPGSGLDPWSGGGGTVHGGLPRWQGVKAAFKTTLSSRIAPGLAAAAVAAAAAAEWPPAEEGPVAAAATLCATVGRAASAEARPALAHSQSLPSDSPAVSRHGGKHREAGTPRSAASGCHAQPSRTAEGSPGDPGRSSDEGEGGVMFGSLEDEEDVTARTLSVAVPARGAPVAEAQEVGAELAHDTAPSQAQAQELEPSAAAERAAFASSGVSFSGQHGRGGRNGGGGGGGGGEGGGAAAAAAAARAAYATSSHGKSLGRRLASAIAVAPGGLVRSVSIAIRRRATDELQLSPPSQSARWDVGLWALRAAAAAPVAGRSHRNSLGGLYAAASQTMAAVDEHVSADYSGHGQDHAHGHRAPEPCTLVRRGLMVRIGMHTGVRHATDLQYSEVAARWKYSGEVLAAAKSVSDAANGGDVLVSAATLARLSTDVLTKRCHLLYVGRHVLRGGDADATAAGAAVAAAVPPPPPAPGGVADLYGVYSLRLLPRLGLYRPPRTAQALGLSALEAPLGRVSYGLLVCPGLAAMAQQHLSSPVVSEARTALAAISTDQLLACHGFAAAPPQPAGGCGAAGTAVGAFRNPYHAILWALQAQEDLLHHPWSDELLGHEQFEEIVAPAAAAVALSATDAQRLQRGPASVPSVPLPGGRVSPMSPAVSGQLPAQGQGLAASPPTLGRSQWKEHVLSTSPPTPAQLAARVRSGAEWEQERADQAGKAPRLSRGAAGRDSGGGMRDSRGGASGATTTEPGVAIPMAAGAQETAAAAEPRPGLVWAFSSRTQTTKGTRTMTSFDGSASAALGAAAPAPPRVCPGGTGGTRPRSPRRSAPGDVALSSSLPPAASSGAAAAAAAAGGPGRAQPALPTQPARPPVRFPVVAPYDSTYTDDDPERESANAATAHSLALSGAWAAGPPLQLPTPLLLSTPFNAQDADSAGAGGEDDGLAPLAPMGVWRRETDAGAAQSAGVLPTLAPSVAGPSVAGTFTGMAPAALGPGGEGSVLLFRGPRIKAAISYGPLKASLDPLTGRIRYEGKPAAQAAKMVYYAAIGMVVASVQAVDSGHAEEEDPALQDGTRTGTSYGNLGAPRIGIIGSGGGGPAAECGGPRDAPARAQAPVARADSFRNDPEGPSAAMAAAAAAAAAALLNIMPEGGGGDVGTGGLSHQPDTGLPLGAEDSLAHLAAALTAAGSPSGAAAWRPGRRGAAALPAAAAARRQRTSEAEGRTSDARSSNSGPLGANGGVLSSSPAAESRFASGSSTPYSGGSYTYAQNPLFGFGGVGGGASNSGAAGAAGGANPLKPDSRAPSRTARTMSNLNPDSRQASRTFMPRQSALSMTGGHAAGGGALSCASSQTHSHLSAAAAAAAAAGAVAAAPAALRRSPSPDSLRRLANRRGALKPPPAALARGASASRAEAAAAAASVAAVEAARRASQRAAPGHVSLLTSVSRRLHGEGLKTAASDPVPAARNSLKPLAPAAEEGAAAPAAGGPIAAQLASSASQRRVSAAAAAEAAAGGAQGCSPRAALPQRMVTANLASRVRRQAPPRHASERLVGAFARGRGAANPYERLPPAQAQAPGALEDRRNGTAHEGHHNAAAAAAVTANDNAWCSSSLRLVSQDPATLTSPLVRLPSPPRPGAAIAAAGAAPHPGCPQLLQQRDSQRIFPGASGVSATGPRAAAALPSVQVLSHGTAQRLHSQPQPPPHGAEAWVSGMMSGPQATLAAVMAARPSWYGYGGHAEYDGAGGGRPQSGSRVLAGMTHGSPPHGHSSYLNPLCAMPQLQSAALWRSNASGAGAPRWGGGAGAGGGSARNSGVGGGLMASPVSAAAAAAAALLTAGSRRAGSLGVAASQSPAAGRSVGPASGAIPPRATFSNSGCLTVSSGIGGGVCGVGAGLQPDFSNGTGGLPKVLEAVGLDEVAMLPVVLKKPNRGNSQSMVVYLCRFASSARTFEMQQRLASLGRGDATAAAAAAAVAAAEPAAMAERELSPRIACGGASSSTQQPAHGSGGDGAPEARAAEHRLVHVAAALFSHGPRHLQHGGPPAGQEAGSQAHSPASLPGRRASLASAHAGRRASLTGFVWPRTTPDLSRSSVGNDPRSDAAATAPPSGPRTLTGAVGGVPAAVTEAGGRPAGRSGRGGGGGLIQRLRRASLDTGVGMPRRRAGRNGGGTGAGAAHGGGLHPLGEVRTMSVKRVQRGAGLSGPLNPLFLAAPRGAMSATLPHLQGPHPMGYGAAVPAFAAAVLSSGAGAPAASAPMPFGPTLPYGVPHHMSYGVVYHGGGGTAAAVSGPVGLAVAAGGAANIAQRAVFRSCAGGGGGGGPVGGVAAGGDGGGGTAGTSYEEATAASCHVPGQQLDPTLTLASAGDWASHTGGIAGSGAGLPHGSPFPSQPLILVGSGSGSNPGVSDSGAAGTAGWAGGSLGPGLWELTGAGAAPMRVAGSGRIPPPLNMMSPTEEGQETEAEAE